MSFRSDDRGAAIQVGAIILFAFVILAITAYQASVVPNQNNQIEYNHNQEVQSQLQDLEAAIGSTSSAGERRTVTIDLGTEYPARTIFVNPPNPSGRLETVGTSDPDVNFTVANAVATNEDANDFWDGTTTHNYTSGSVVYRPNYNVYSEAPTTIVEHSLVYNVFRDGTKLTVNSQSVFDGDTISLVALRGDVSEQSGTVNVNVRPVSSSTQSIRVENASGDNVNVSLVTRLSASEWRGILLDDYEFANQTRGGHIVGVSKIGEVDIGSGVTANVIEFVLERDVTYTLQLARVGVGDLSGAAETTDPAYAVALADTVTTDENVNATVTVEVRDKYNNPKAGVEVYASVDGNNGNIVDSPLTTDEDGHVTFTYNTTKNIDGDAKQDTVRVSSQDDTWSNFDAGAPENTTTEVVVKNTDGSGQGSGGNYDLKWDFAYIEDQNTFTQCYGSNDTCVYNISQTTSDNLDMRANTTPSTSEIFVDFGHNDSTIVRAFNPSEGVTDADGYRTTTLAFENGDPTGTLRLLASAIEDPERMRLKVVGGGGGGGGGGSAPVIGTFSTNDKSQSTGNVRARYDIDWSVSDPDGDLQSVTVYVNNTDTGTTQAEYTGASGSEKFESQNDYGDSYEIKIIAVDSQGNRKCLVKTGPANDVNDESESSC